MSYQNYDPTDGGMSNSQPFPPTADESASTPMNSSVPAIPDVDPADTAPGSGLSGVAQQASSLARDQISEGLGHAADGVEHVANLADKAGQNLRQHDQDALAQYASRAADQLEQFATHLRETPPEQLLAETEQTLKRQPALVLAGSVALGLLAARVFKHTRSDNKH